MRRKAILTLILVVMATAAHAQQAEIEAANTKWIEMFNKGDFDGVASLYTEDAMAFAYSGER